ncbi:lactonase family protein [Sphingomonas spermidinifaciens]|nr:beta-propeller fold lactonase family protein [Sphingomonas spermidinifaciens]
MPAFWVGTYATRGGAGLTPLIRASGYEMGAPIPAVQNVSFGVRSRRRTLLYLVDEQGGAIGVFRRDAQLALCARVAAGGEAPCYMALDANERRLAVAHYASGSVALFTLDPQTGLPRGEPVLWRASGHGPDPHRQEAPHIHCVCFGPDGRLFVVDLGTDRIIALDPADLGRPSVAFTAPGGSGLRHLVFHPRSAIAYLISELASTVTVLSIEGATFGERQRLSTLPPGTSGESLGGHLGINAAGDRLYVTNRGHDSIGVFAIEGARLSPLQHVPSGGASPRFFHLDEAAREMLVAHEEQGGVTRFSIKDDGTLARQPGRLDIAGAVFIVAA